MTNKENWLVGILTVLALAGIYVGILLWGNEGGLSEEEEAQWEEYAWDEYQDSQAESLESTR